MLKRILITGAWVFCGIVGLQAEEEILSAPSIEQNRYEHRKVVADEESEKDLTPGALVCNGKEDKCSKEGDQEESRSSGLFSVFRDDHKDEENLLACKDCR
jgi:hypothetical protein